MKVNVDASMSVRNVTNWRVSKRRGSSNHRVASISSSPTTSNSSIRLSSISTISSRLSSTSSTRHSSSNKATTLSSHLIKDTHSNNSTRVDTSKKVVPTASVHAHQVQVRVEVMGTGID